MIETVVGAIFGSVSTACLLALSVYIYLVNRGDSLVVYSAEDKRLMSFGRTSVVALAAIGFLVCMYQGAHGMLWWMPSEWGSIDEDGEYSTARSFLASMFTFFGGIAFVSFVDKASRYPFAMRHLATEARELRRILDGSMSKLRLAELEKEFDETIAALDARSEEQAKLMGLDPYKRRLMPAAQTMYLYKELLALAKARREAIERQS